MFLMSSSGPKSNGVFEGKRTVDSEGTPLSLSNSKHVKARYHFLTEVATSGDISV